MGYDFMFMSLGSNPPVCFPCEYSDAPPDWAAIEQEKIMARLRELGATGYDSNVFEIQPASDESLGVRVSDCTVGIDVHADWLHVLTLYRELKSVDPTLLVFDEQTGTFHNESSFTEFVGI